MKNRPLFKVADIFVVLLVLALCSSLILFKNHSDENLSVTLYQDGNVITQVKLQDVINSYTIELDGGVEVEITSTFAQIISSSCKSQQCVNTGKLFHGGDTSVCIPNKVILTIDSNEDKVYQTY